MKTSYLPAKILLIVSFGYCLIFSSGCNEKVEDKPSCPWDMERLSKVPDFKWAGKEDGIWSVIFQGEPYRGESTRVFAYYASPSTLKGEFNTGEKYPGIVLVHGGGGKAFKKWARMWAERGYAAISADNRGQRDGFMYLKGGYPEHANKFTFGMVDESLTDQWPYHAVSNTILAHSLIRSFDEVDEHRTAVTGISWGGYNTCITAGVDYRFKAAVPVYGCGFLHENSSWTHLLEELSEEQKKKWVNLWDPSQYIGDAWMPVFFVNGTNDRHYRLDVYDKTYDLVQGDKNIRIEVNMRHSHPAGWESEEIGLFVDSYLKDEMPLPKIGPLIIESGKIKAEVESAPEIKGAKFNYSKELRKPNHLRKWKTVDADFKNGTVSAKLPEDAKLWFFTVTDERGAMVSSEVEIVRKKE